ncbi:uncharacterized protein LOC141525997 [Cotesia typhae]|uniref:uncharacterized protein LOC141525997 n=1 Tax=Cotesia typhae TaxID=2053667 RepID=UPI003D6982B2
MSDRESIESLCSCADYVFGSKNWSHEIKAQTLESRKSYIGCLTTVRITLSDRRFHEGIGYFEEYDNINEFSFAEIREKSLIDGIYNALLYFQEIRTYFERKEQERMMRLVKQAKQQQEWKLKNEKNIATESTEIEDEEVIKGRVGEEVDKEKNGGTREKRRRLKK